MTTEPSDIDLLNQIPKIIGTYEICEELGAGLLGGVCSAIHKYTDERVAIKIFSKSSLQIYRSELPLINNEISVLKILNHKNIIKLYEVFESPTHIYLVTEHCSGKELFDLISSKKRLTEPEAKTLFYQVISALEYMHSMNVCHRDIKPENILFDSKGQIKLTDFDFSCYYSNKQTQLHEDLGTPSYACPEMHKGEMYLPELADVWSCGVLLYVMVCGCCPFNDEDENENESESAIIQGVYDVPSYLSESVVDLIKHMIQPDVSQRYTFKEVIQHEWLNDVSSDNDNNVVSKGVNYFEMKYPIDSRILNICETYGFDQVRIRNDLQSNKFNCYTAVYKLFVKKVYDAGISCLNDYCSDEYKAYIEDERNYYTEEEKREVRERFEMKERERKEKLEEQEKEMFEKEERAFKELNDIDKELTNNNNNGNGNDNAVCPNTKITTPIRKRISNKKVNNDNNNNNSKLLTTPDKRPNNTFNKSALVSSNTSCKKSKFKSAIESIVKSPMTILYHNNIRPNTNFSLKDKHNSCSNNNNNNKAGESSNNSDDNDNDDDDDYSSENSNSSSSEYDSSSVSSYSDNNYNNNNINALTPVKENISDRGDTSETQNKYKQLHLTNDDSYYSITDNCSASPKLSSKTNLIYTNIIGEKLQQTLIQPNNTPSNIKYRKHTLNPEMLRKHPARRRNAIVNRNELEQALRIYHENMLNDSSNFSDDDSSSYHSSYMSNSVISLKLPQTHKNVNDSSYDSTDLNGLNVPKELNQGEYELYQRLALELIERNKQEEEERQRIINEDKKRYEEEQQRIKEAKDQQRKEEEQRKKEELKLKLQKRRLVAQILQNVNKSKSLNQQQYNDMGVTEQIIVDEQQQQQQRSRKASVNKRSGTKYTSIADIRKLLTKTPNSTKTRRFSMTLSSKQHQPHNETITRVRKSTIANNSHNMHISSLVIFETPDNNNGLNKRISYINSNGNNGNHHLQNQSTKSEIKIKPFINKENINTTNTITESNVKQFITKNKSFAPPTNDNSFSSLLITNHKAKISDVSEKSCTNKEFKKKMLRQKVLGDGYNKAFIAELEEFKLKKMEENMKFKEELEKLEKFKDTQNEKYQMQLIMIRMEKLKKLKENNKLITKLERAVIRENSFVDNNINNTGSKSMMKRLSTRKKEVFIFDEGVTKIPGNFELQVTDNDNNIIKQDEMNTTKRKHKHKHRDKDKDKEKSKHKSEHKDKDKEHKEHKDDKAHKDKDKHEHKEKHHKDKTELKRTKHKKKHHTKNKSIISINDHNTKTHETIVNPNTNANTNHISNNNTNHHHIINKFTNKEINKHNKHIPITNTLSSSNITMNNRIKKLPPPINPSSITIPNNTATTKSKRLHKRNHNKENEDDKFKRQTLKFEKLIKEVKVKEPTHKPSPSKHELKIRTNTTTTHIPTHTRTNTSITMTTNSNIHHHSRTKSQNTNLLDKVNKDSSILSKQHHHQPSKKQKNTNTNTNTIQDNTSNTKEVPSLNGYKINFFHQKPDLNLSFSFLNNQSSISGIHHNTSFNCGGVNNNNNNINPNFSITNTTNICITNRSVIETNNNNNNIKHDEQQRDKNDDDLSMCFTERLFYNSKQNSFSLNPSKSKFKSSLYKSNSNNPNIYHNKKENSFNFGEYKDKASLLKRIHIRTESMPIQEEIFQNERTHKNQSKSKGVSNIKHTNSIKDNNNTKHINNNSNLTKSIEIYNYDSKKDVSINQYDSNTVNKKYIHSKKTILSNRLCKSKHIHHQHHKSVFNTMSNNLSGYNLSQSINNNTNNNSTSNINNNNNEPSTIKSNKLNTSTTMTKSQSSTKTPIKNNDAFNMSHSTNISNINSTNTSMQYYHINNNSNYPLNTFYNNTNTTNKSMVQHSSHSNYNSISSSNQYSTNTIGSTQNNKQTLHKSTKTQPFLDKDIYNTDITLSKPNTSRVSTNNVHKRNENRSNIYHPNHNTIIINKRNAKNVLPSMTTTHVKEPAYYEGLVDISCISTVSLRETINQLVAKLKLHNVFYLQVNSYTYRCNKKKTSFDIEICQIYSKMYYYMLKIKSGGVNMQKEVITQLFSN